MSHRLEQSMERRAAGTVGVRHAAEEAATLATRSALVVDDDEFVRNSVARQLSRLGVERVVMAADGASAARLLESNGPFDVIVLDLMMPEMDGVEFLRRLGRAARHSDLILASGLDQKTLKTAEQLAGAHGLIVLGSLAKPVTTGQLRDLLGRRLPVPRAAVEQEIGPDRIAAALRAGHITPWFQPKVCARTGRLESVETLARWIDPDAGSISPARFIPVAESSALIDGLTVAMIGGAFAAVKEWQGIGLRPELAINLSRRSLSNVGLPDRIARLAIDFGIDPARVTFELTETSVMGRLSEVLDTLARLRLKGFRLSIDDFGTGFSTLEQLKLLPLSELKLDLFFVRNACHDRPARDIIESSVELARAFGLTTVAEGVETQEAADLMRDLGVDQLQGFLFAPALPKDELVEWWSARRA